jgi:hypothetical protein
MSSWEVSQGGWSPSAGSFGVLHARLCLQHSKTPPSTLSPPQTPHLCHRELGEDALVEQQVLVDGLGLGADRLDELLQGGGLLGAGELQEPGWVGVGGDGWGVGWLC